MAVGQSKAVGGAKIGEARAKRAVFIRLARRGDRHQVPTRFSRDGAKQKRAEKFSARLKIREKAIL
jgi:hypothetical protein